MSQAKKIVTAFLNSAEGYFHTKRIIEDQVKQPRDLYGPMSDRPEKWDYTDIRDITASDLNVIISAALKSIDKDLYNTSPDTAISASLGLSIHSISKGKFQSKIDSPTYNFLYDAVKKKLARRKKK